MKEFRLKADTVFTAGDLEDACMKLIEHFMAVGDIRSWEVDISAEAHGRFLNHVGSFDLKPMEKEHDR